MILAVGLVNYSDSRSGKDELAVARMARSITEIHGGRFLSIHWMAGDPKMVLTFEGRSIETARTVFATLSKQANVAIDLLPAMTEGQKERAVAQEVTE